MTDSNKSIPELAWFCLTTQPKHEHIAAAHLRQMENVEVYCPRLRFRRATRKGPVWFTEALFPKYLFARFNPLVSQKQVSYAHGVTGLVRFSETPAIVPDQVIEEMRQVIGGEECKIIDSKVREGDSVTISHGVFKGIATLVTQVLPSRERVRVLMDMLGACREVEVTQADLVLTNVRSSTVFT